MKQPVQRIVMLTGVAAAALVMSSAIAQAAPVRRLYQDVKLPTQQVIEKQTVSAPAVNGTNQVLSANAGNTSLTAVTVSTFAAQPDVPRNLIITPATSAGDVSTCTVVVTGTNIFNQSITENFSFTSGSLTAATGSKAFKTVSSVAFPSGCEKGSYTATWSVGYGSKLGLNRCMAKASDFLQAGLAGVRESTFATIAADASHVESNTAALNSSLNASDVQLYFIQNFGCFP